jgi:hypothetical protein
MKDEAIRLLSVQIAREQSEVSELNEAFDDLKEQAFGILLIHSANPYASGLPPEYSQIRLHIRANRTAHRAAMAQISNLEKFKAALVGDERYATDKLKDVATALAALETEGPLTG